MPIGSDQGELVETIAVDNSMAFVNATISGNIAERASGVDCLVDDGAILTSLDGNLEAAADCGFLDATDQQFVFNPGIAALPDDGGSTLTHDLPGDSPAVDVALDPSCNDEAEAKDQRGFDRFYDGDGILQCDRGAVEYRGL